MIAAGLLGAVVLCLLATACGDDPGAGSILAGGRTEQLDVVAAGVAGFDGGDLRADAAAVDSSGAGSTTVWAVDQLDVSITGVGSVRYYGEAEVSSAATATGTLEALGPK